MDLGKYERELRKIEDEKKFRAQRVKDLNEAKKQLGEYLKKFEGRECMLTSIREDMKAVEDELNDLA